MILRALKIVSITFFLSGCAFFKPTIDSEELDYPDPDSEMISLIDSYRPGLERVMGSRIAVVMDTLTFNHTEGSLGNMAADALRFRASRELERFIHIGIINESSFQTYFTPGELTLGHIYEFMPYENHLVVLELKGLAVQNLIQQVAEIGGAPVSGTRFSIDDQNRARGIIVNSEVIDSDKNYLVATTNWIADGGGDQFSALREPVSRIDLPDIEIRDLYVDFFRGRAELYNEPDGRIRK